MKDRVARAIVLCVGLVLLSPFASAAPRSVEVPIEFGLDDLTFSVVEGYDLVEVLGDKCSLDGEPGAPWLPVRDVHVLLPPGTLASKIEVTVLDEVELDGEYFVYPAQKPACLSAPKPPPFMEPDPKVYRHVAPIHADGAVLLDTMIVRGYSIAVVRVYPLKYVPAIGKLSLRTKIDVNVRLKPMPAHGGLRVRKRERVFEKLVRHDVVNPERIKLEYGARPFSPRSTDEGLVGEGVEGVGAEGGGEQPLSAPDPDDVQYLIICAASMIDEFQPLVDWKTKKGVPAEAVSVDWIYANYSGEDNQEQIKACIKDYVEEKGTVWVVLGGDDTIVPDRDCYGDVSDGTYTDTTIPTDLYYSGLDDMDWDDNDNGIAAEVPRDSIDMGPDVFVGRFPIRTASHATAIVNKTIEYEKNQPSSGFAEKMILIGVSLWNTGDAEGKSEYMYSGWIDPYWDPVRIRFYDTATDFPGGASYQVNVANMTDQLEDGYNLLHMATHGSQTLWGMETGGNYNSSNAQSVSNPGKYVNIVTMACSTNAFETAWYPSDPCLSEGFIRNPDGGAVTYIGGSRYGWGYATMTSHGSSFIYDRTFYKFLFTGEPDEHPQQVGAVYAQMKQYFAASCKKYGSMRWCQFSINLMGDPELSLYTADPSSFGASFEEAIPAGTQTFAIETGVADAHVCLSKDGEVYTYGDADASGHFEASISPATPGTMHVTITKPNYLPYEGTAVVTATYYVNGATGNDSWDGLAPAWDGAHGPKATIQAGIDAASGGCEVLVATGTYTGGGNLNLDFGGKAITVRSEDNAVSVVLDCRSAGRGFTFHSGEAASSVVRGFTILNGHAAEGGGIDCDGSSPTLVNCTLIGNTASTSGGGIACRNGSSPTMTGCTLLGNRAGTEGGGIICLDGSSPTVTGCIVWDNSPQAIAVVSGAPTVEYCDVQGGWSGVGNIDADPLVARDGHLMAGSPCIDGCPTGPTNDRDGEARPVPVGGGYDIGADEFADTDGDGLPDWWELLHFGTATGAEALGDAETDGLTNLVEYEYTTDPWNPDTDTDGLVDSDEVCVYETDPLKAADITDVYWDQDDTSVVIVFASRQGAAYVLERADADAYADDLTWYTLPEDTLVGGAAQGMFRDNLTANPVATAFRFYRVKRADDTNTSRQTAGVFGLTLLIQWTMQDFVISTPLVPDPDHASVEQIIGEQINRSTPFLRRLVPETGLVDRMVYDRDIGTWSLMQGEAFDIEPGKSYQLFAGGGIEETLTVWLTGTVPEEGVSTIVTKPSWTQSDRWLAYSMPRGTTLGELGLVEAVSYWNPANVVRLKPLGTEIRQTFQYNDGMWFDVLNPGVDAGSTPIACGEGIVLTRLGVPTEQDTWVQPAWYFHPPNAW